MKKFEFYVNFSKKLSQNRRITIIYYKDKYGDFVLWYEYRINKQFLKAENIFTYGIEIVDENGNIAASVKDVFAHEEQARDFAHMCEKNNVSAIHLRDVIEDYLCAGLENEDIKWYNLSKG